MSTVTSSNEHLTFNADGSSKNILFQANGTQKASISSAGLFTSTTIDATVLTGTLPAISGANLTNLPATDISGKLNLSGGTMTGTVISPSFTSTAGGTFTTAAGNDLNIVYPDSRSLFIKEAGTTHVTIDNTGQVGIGKTPIRALDIKQASGDPGVRLESASYSMDVLTLRNSNGRLDVGPTLLAGYRPAAHNPPAAAPAPLEAAPPAVCPKTRSSRRRAPPPASPRPSRA